MPEILDLKSFSLYHQITLQANTFLVHWVAAPSLKKYLHWKVIMVEKYSLLYSSNSCTACLQAARFLSQGAWATRSNHTDSNLLKWGQDLLLERTGFSKFQESIYHMSKSGQTLKIKHNHSRSIQKLAFIWKSKYWFSKCNKLLVISGVSF